MEGRGIELKSIIVRNLVMSDTQNLKYTVSVKRFLRKRVSISYAITCEFTCNVFLEQINSQTQRK